MVFTATILDTSSDLDILYPITNTSLCVPKPLTPVTMHAGSSSWSSSCNVRQYRYFSLVQLPNNHSLELKIVLQYTAHVSEQYCLNKIFGPKRSEEKEIVESSEEC